MAKKKRRDKEVTRLRREVEILKAQMAAETPLPKEKPPAQQAEKKHPIPVAKEVIPTLNSTYLKKDLCKSLLLTLLALTILMILYFR